VAGCGSTKSSSASVPTGAVAVVAGNPISTQAYKHWFFVDAKNQTPVIPSDPPNFTKCISDAKAAIPSLRTSTNAKLKSDCQSLYTTINTQTMGFLIQAYQFQAEAHKQGISVTPAQVAAELTTEKKGQFKTPKAYTQFLTQSGQTNADIEYRILFSLVSKKLLAKQNTTVTTADISAYYNAHKSTFGTPEQRSMRVVLAKNNTQAVAALKAIKGGQSWKVVAKKYSTDPTTKNSGGLLKNVSSGQQDAALSKAAFAAPKGKLVGPVKGQFGVYVFEVIGITPASQRTLSQASKQIKTTLTSQKQQTAQTAISTLVKKDWENRTVCKSQYAVAGCKGFKPPATSTTPAAGATTPGAGATTPAAPGTGASTTPAPSTGTSAAPPATTPSGSGSGSGSGSTGTSTSNK
jgi:parvulin-like peptidyl-prolyl isomerase